MNDPVWPSFDESMAELRQRWAEKGLPPLPEADNRVVMNLCGLLRYCMCEPRLSEAHRFAVIWMSDDADAKVEYLNVSYQESQVAP